MRAIGTHLCTEVETELEADENSGAEIYALVSTCQHTPILESFPFTKTTRKSLAWLT